MAIEFRDGPAGRRAGLIGGPDVRAVVDAVRSARDADPDCDPETVVAQETGLTVEQIREAVAFASIELARLQDDQAIAALDLRAQFEAEGRSRWSEADSNGHVTVHDDGE